MSWKSGGSRISERHEEEGGGGEKMGCHVVVELVEHGALRVPRGESCDDCQTGVGGKEVGKV